MSIAPSYKNNEEKTHDNHDWILNVNYPEISTPINALFLEYTCTGPDKINC